jgi:hypothetical protein
MDVKKYSMYIVQLPMPACSVGSNVTHITSYEKHRDSNCSGVSTPLLCTDLEGHDSSVSIVMGYRLDRRVLIADRRESFFSLLHSVQTSCGAHPASYPTGTGGSFLGVKAADS